MTSKMRNERRNIYIADCGTATAIIIGRDGIAVARSGGCPAQRILAGVRNYSDPQRLADIVLARWMDGYDGDPHECGLTVTVSAHDDVLAEAHA